MDAYIIVNGNVSRCQYVRRDIFHPGYLIYRERATGIQYMVIRKWHCSFNRQWVWNKGGYHRRDIHVVKRLRWYPVSWVLLRVALWRSACIVGIRNVYKRIFGHGNKVRPNHRG